MNKLEPWFPVFGILLSVFIAILFIIISSQRPLTFLENVLFQIFILSSGVIGSYYTGKKSEINAGQEIVKSQARPIVRRLLTLGFSISGGVKEIERYFAGEGEQDAETTLKVLRAIIYEQIRHAADTLEDWRDIIPDIANEVQERSNAVDRSAK